VSHEFRQAARACCVGRALVGLRPAAKTAGKVRVKAKDYVMKAKDYVMKDTTS
jgi:hypothetical protein